MATRRLIAMRAISGLALPLLLGLPWWIDPSGSVGLCVGIAAPCLMIGVVRSSPAWTASGGALALLALTLALWRSPSTLSMFGAFGFGLALLFTADSVHWVNRMGDAAVDPSVWRGQICWWLGRAAIALAATIVLSLIASMISVALPLLGRPVLAGIGACVAFGAAMRLRWSGAKG